MHALLISTLEPAEVIGMLGLPKHLVHDADAVVLAYGTLYDKRGGAVETEIKESKQGIGITKRSKKRFEAQQMVMLLGSLAHNLIVWSRRWVTVDALRFGIVRLTKKDVISAARAAYFRNERLRISLLSPSFSIRNHQSLRLALFPILLELSRC
jgi:hypothetical protein